MVAIQQGVGLMIDDSVSLLQGVSCDDAEGFVSGVREDLIEIEYPQAGGLLELIPLLRGRETLSLSIHVFRRFQVEDFQTRLPRMHVQIQDLVDAPGNDIYAIIDSTVNHFSIPERWVEESFPVILNWLHRREREVSLRFHGSTDFVVNYQLTTLADYHWLEEPMIGIDLESSIAGHSRSLMILPPITDGGGEFRILTGRSLRNPLSHCIPGSMIFVSPQFVSPNPNEWGIVGSPFVVDAFPRGHIHNESSMPGVYRIDTASLVDVVPDAVYSNIIREIRSIGGTILGLTIPWIGTEILDCDSIDQFPTIALSLYQNMGSFASTGTLYIEPFDYTTILPGGRCVVHIVPQTRAVNQQLTIGSNILQNIGLLFDNINSRIGFCDPLTS